MEKTTTLVNNIYSDATEYIGLQSRSIKLEVYERITNIISSGISASVIILFGAFSFLFINIGLAFWLSELFFSHKLGFLCLGGFYFVVLGLYLAFRHKFAKNRVKNAVLLKLSKTMNDYDLLLKEQAELQQKVRESEASLKSNLEELKSNINTLNEDFKRLKRNFVPETNGETNATVGPKIPRAIITTILDLVLDKIVLRNAGIVQRTVLPIIANALVTSKVFKEGKKTSFIENLKLKFSKFLM